MVNLQGLQDEIDNKAKELDQLVDTLQDTIRALNRRGYKLYDEENKEYFLTDKIMFDKGELKFLVGFERES
jgi:hypothetical protein